jgi:shikimate 5-dehydrogenase
MDGLMPLACQARRSLALWTGIEVETQAFVRAATELVAPETTRNP